MLNRCLYYNCIRLHVTPYVNYLLKLYYTLHNVLSIIIILYIIYILFALRLYYTLQVLVLSVPYLLSLCPLFSGKVEVCAFLFNISQELYCAVSMSARKTVQWRNKLVLDTFQKQLKFHPLCRPNVFVLALTNDFARHSRSSSMQTMLRTYRYHIYNNFIWQVVTFATGHMKRIR